MKSFGKWFLPIATFGILTFVAVENGNPLLYEPGRDGGSFIYIGKQILQGKILYIDVWDSKGPLIFYINTLGLIIGGGTRWGVWILEYLFLTLSSLIGYFIFLRKFGVLTAVASISVGVMGARILFGQGNYTEEYSLIFTWISISAFTQSFIAPEKKQYPLLMGSMLAVNLLLRANNIATAFTALLVCLIFTWVKFGVKTALKRSLCALAGIALILAPVSIYFAIIGTLDEMIQASITYNLSYSFTARSDIYRLNIFETSLIPAIRSLRIWIVIPLLGYLILIYQFIRVKGARLDPMKWLILAAWPVEICASSISGRAYGHYFICWLPVMILASGVFFDNFQRYVLHPNIISLFNLRKPHYAALSTILLFLLAFHNDYLQYLKTFNRLINHREQGIEYFPPIAEYILNNTSPQDEVLVWGGQVGINYLSNRNSPNGYIFYPLYSNSEIGLSLQNSYYQDLINHPPPLIVDASKVAPDELPSLDPEILPHQRILYELAQNTWETLEFISSHYHCIDDIDGFSVYQLTE